MKIKLLKESQRVNMKIMDEPKLEYDKFYKVMPPGEEVKKLIKILTENDADTYIGEDNIEDSCQKLIELIKNHTYIMV